MMALNSNLQDFALRLAQTEFADSSGIVIAYWSDPIVIHNEGSVCNDRYVSY